MPAHTITSPPPWATQSTIWTSANRLPTRCHTQGFKVFIFFTYSIIQDIITLSAICPVQWKPGFIHEKNTSPKCQTPSNVSIFPLKSVTTTNCSQVKTMTSMQMSFPETVSDSLCRDSLVMQTECCNSCPGGWSQAILEVKMLDVEVLGWCGYTWSAVVRPVGCTAKFSETPLETAYGREMNIQFTGNNSGGQSCSQHANCTLPQNLRHLWYYAVW